MRRAFQQTGQSDLAIQVRPLMGMRLSEIVDLGQDFDRMATQLPEDANVEASSRDCAVSLQAQGEFVTEVNGELLYRALENVIRNAVIQTQVGQLYICVQNHGPGIPDDMLEKIFEPFTRIDGSGTEKGFGLGLAISKKALEKHNGWIRPRNSPVGRLIMDISLPISGSGDE